MPNKIKIPKLSLSALIFYFIFMFLIFVGILPSAEIILSSLTTLYEKYGLIALFIAQFLEGLVYFGLYFAGSSILLFIVLFSDGKILTILNMSLVISFALTLVSIFNYVLGKHIVSKALRETNAIKEKRKKSKTFLLSCLHPNALAFYFFNLGLKNKNFWEITFVPLIMLPYFFVIIYFISLARPLIEENSENPYILGLILLIWFLIEFIMKNWKIKHSQSNKN